jgi:hypothetical protein
MIGFCQLHHLMVFGAMYQKLFAGPRIKTWKVSIGHGTINPTVFLKELIFYMFARRTNKCHPGMLCQGRVSRDGKCTVCDIR